MMRRFFILGALLPASLSTAYAQGPIYQHSTITGVFTAPIAGVTPDGIDGEEGVASPVLQKKDDTRAVQKEAAIEKEFQNVYNGIAFPLVSTGIAQNFTIINGSIPTSAIVGTATNSTPRAGRFGEPISATASNISCGTSNAFFDAASIALTPGDWEVSAMCSGSLNGATQTVFYCGLGTVTGNDGTGAVTGVNAFIGPPPTAAYDIGGSIPPYRYSLAVNTTIYLKSLCVYSAGTPKVGGARISSRRQ